MSADDPTRKPDRWEKVQTEERRRLNRRDVCLVLLLLAPIIWVLFAASGLCEHGKNAATIQMVNNARKIGLALFEFELEFGKLPDASTIPEVKKLTGTALTLTDATSNDLFKQLIATKVVASEKLFGAFETNSKPDDIFDKDSNALAAGECGFAYALGPSITEDPARPLAFGPVIPGTRNFDLKINKGKMVVLRADNSIATINVDPRGRVNLGEKDSFLHPAGSFWKGKPLEIKWPR